MAALSVGALPAAADDTARITSLGTHVVFLDGRTSVIEDVTMDFKDGGTGPIRHTIPGTVPHEHGDGSRDLGLGRVEVRALDGLAPVTVRAGDNGTDILFGGESDDPEPTGRRSVQISYRYETLDVPDGERARIRFDATAGGWSAPIKSARAEISSRAGVAKVGCARGRTPHAGGDTTCASRSVVGDTAIVTAKSLDAGQAFTVDALFPADAGTARLPEKPAAPKPVRKEDGPPIALIAVFVIALPVAMAAAIFVDRRRRTG